MSRDTRVVINYDTCQGGDPSQFCDSSDLMLTYCDIC